MKKVLLGLLALSSLSFGSYISSEYTNNTIGRETGTQKLDTNVGTNLGDTSLQFTIRDIYNGGGYQRFRATKSLNSDFKIRYQYYNANSGKATNSVILYYTPNELNKLSNYSTQFQFDVDKKASQDFTLDVSMWNSYKVDQNLIESLYVYADVYMRNLNNTDVVYVDVYSNFHLIDIDFKGFNLYKKAQLYSWGSYDTKQMDYNSSDGVNATIGVQKKLGEIDTRLQYKIDQKFDNVDPVHTVSVRVNYTF